MQWKEYAQENLMMTWTTTKEAANTYKQLDGQTYLSWICIICIIAEKERPMAASESAIVTHG